ncbi:MAG TPA: hypothetical protein VGD67_19480 [Pseudonocardiaceae bacterium]
MIRTTTVPGHCEVVFRDTDERAVFDRLAAWVRHWYSEIEVCGVAHDVAWDPLPDSPVPGDEREVFTLTLRFRTGALRRPDWPGSAPGGQTD